MMTDERLRGVLMYWRWKSRRWLKHAERSRAHVVGPDTLRRGRSCPTARGGPGAQRFSISSERPLFRVRSAV